MLIIPELETVVLQPPRTASTSIRSAVMKAYPKTFSPYRHMERDGIPKGYDRWQIVGIIRHPFDRLASLYRYMRRYQGNGTTASDVWIAQMCKDADRPFAEWLLESKEMFTDPFDQKGRYFPKYEVMHKAPITRRSQRLWHRPDLGPVDLLKMENPEAIEDRLKIRLPHLNAAQDTNPVSRTSAIDDFLAQHHGWDLAQYA